LAPQVQERFELGFAPEGWQGLWDHLTGKGVAADLILACGLARESDRGKKPYDVFRNRIMFPIRDARGRCIAFGGRAMDPNDNAKYLNSPETELFDKSRTLYNHGPAREAAGKGQPLIVAEGYMDVIALVAGGFEAAVAPLGTAVTEYQLQMLWRMADEPLIALDGDKAGLRAAERVVDLALPLLEAGKSLRFVLMPEGKDPDDLLRAGGARAMQALIDDAQPMVQLLWRRETEGRSFDSPERKAALERACREATGRIRDPSVRGFYERELKDLRWQLFNPRRAFPASPAGARKGRWQPPENARASTKSSALVSADATEAVRLREAVILAALMSCPELAEAFEPQIARMECRDPEHAALRAAIMRHAHAGAETLRAQIAAEIGDDPLEKLMRLPHVAISPPVRHPGDGERAELTLREEFAKLSAVKDVEAELREAVEDIEGRADETMTWRLRQAAEARNRAIRSQQEDRTEYELGENGARLNREERAEFAALLARLGMGKPPRR
jgi:DNA primase